jgi:SAM-dependent methyltransferase
MPVFCNVLWDTRKGATGCDRGDIRLHWCRDCTFVFNAAFDAALMSYTQSYDNCLHFSARFRDYADSLARRLVDRYSLHDKRVVDVGCGKGDFLKLLCELGPNKGVGFDPSFESRDDIDELGDDVTIVRDYYSEKHGEHGGDFLCCRHVLEHVERPAEFLEQVRLGLGQRPGVPVFFEVPNGEYTLRNVFVWDIIYEHPCYFTAESARRLFAAAGYQVAEVGEEFEGQYLGIHASTGAEGQKAAAPGGGVGGDSVRETTAAFAGEFEKLKADWTAELDEIGRQGRRAVIWGAGSKGVTFLNLLDPDVRIALAVDVSPNKQGKYVAGTGQEIVPPESLPRFRPHDILVMNPVYEDEIKSQLAALGVEARVRSL